MQSKIFSVNKTLNLRGKLIDLSQPRVMGILNVTPDSFYDGNKFNGEMEILNQVEKMLKEGADFIDVGGCSSRPGAEEISLDEELNRLIPAIKSIVKNFPEAIISVDTFRSSVVKEAVEVGAAMVNDISGGALDEKMFSTIAALKVPYILMHMRGTPQTMTQQTTYDNLIKDVVDYFHSKIFQLQTLGVKDIVIDPGFGFAKTAEQNFEILNELSQFQILGKPILVGLSRKSTIWKTLKTNPEEALNGTTVLNTVALLNGASILRVHDVREAKETITLLQQMDLK
ncbi:MAG: dihydropteroate synthase [Bacteroidetes bacterium]|nr:dihydropteroate synthase [Bacteroidota bacterium]MBI3482150.1 dihydropteroate synthase [Bacteroidota bacterium]